MSARTASKILRIGIILAFLVAIVPFLLGRLLPGKFGDPRLVLSGVYVGALIGLISATAHIFLSYFSYRDTRRTFTEMRLRERTKELRCIYAVFDACRRADSVDEILKKLPEVVCLAMLNPERCYVMVEYEGNSIGDYPDRKEVKHEFVAPIRVFNSRKGELRVAYTTSDKIMPEEGLFLNLIAGMVAQAIERLETPINGS